MEDAEVGRALRKCRQSVRPACSERDLADCILQQSAFPFSGDSGALEGVIRQLEAGLWVLPRGQLAPFLNAAVACLSAKGADSNRVTALALQAVAIAVTDPPTQDFVGPLLVNPPPDDE